MQPRPCACGTCALERACESCSATSAESSPSRSAHAAISSRVRAAAGRLGSGGWLTGNSWRSRRGTAAPSPSRHRLRPGRDTGRDCDEEITQLECGGRCRRTPHRPSGHGDVVTSAAFGRTGRSVVAASATEPRVMWRRRGPAELEVLATLPAPVKESSPKRRLPSGWLDDRAHVLDPIRRGGADPVGRTSALATMAVQQRDGEVRNSVVVRTDRGTTVLRVMGIALRRRRSRLTERSW